MLLLLPEFFILQDIDNRYASTWSKTVYDVAVASPLGAPAAAVRAAVTPRRTNKDMQRAIHVCNCTPAVTAALPQPGIDGTLHAAANVGATNVPGSSRARHA